MNKSVGYAAQNATAPLELFHFERREPGPSDVKIEIQYCGVCHSDLHMVRNEWGNSIYPMVPGHEIVGKVIQVGANVRKFKSGDLAGVGCLVGSCGTCPECKENLEQYCPGMVLTYSSPEPKTGRVTYGGYSDHIVVDEHFAVRVPAKLNLASVAPLLCAGITTYSPLRHWNVRAGQKVGIVGLGGLGHMGVKIAAALGAHVVLFTTSSGKKEDAKRLGAHEVVLSKSPEEMKRHTRSLDFILNTVAAPHDLDAYVNLLARDGTMCLVGLPNAPHPTPNITGLIFGRRQIAGSIIGGLAETQEMLDFCADHGIVSDIEMIPIQKINEAYVRMLRSDVKYRFVIDMASLRSQEK